MGATSTGHGGWTQLNVVCIATKNGTLPLDWYEHFYSLRILL
jgi:hypothetical protein